jgi:hypothetical protein
MTTHEAQQTHQPDETTRRVGTKLLFENDRVRVWENVLLPGDGLPRHEHTCDYVAVHLTRSRIAVVQPGREPETGEQPAGFVRYTDVGQGIVHTIENVGDSEHREILVELKGPSRAASPQAPQTNEERLEG